MEWTGYKTIKNFSADKSHIKRKIPRKVLFVKTKLFAVHQFSEWVLLEGLVEPFNVGRVFNW